jgi:uncharacterized lipoprotein YddW (UPF0748 family)
MLAWMGMVAVQVAAQDPPEVPREFRAAWVATVANIDWPSKSNLPVAEQQQEMIQILDRASELGLNAIVFQVRPCADALYASPLEPWSEFLTGEQGKAPEPMYDPLEHWVRESHRRGLELHAWFNPYRARHTQAKSPLAENHVAKTIPHAVKEYGGYLWLDPAETAASDHTYRVIMDVVSRYDVDGIHFDDYFYPYPVNQPDSNPPAELPFPDEPAWKAYLASDIAPKRARDDWRRENVNQLIERLYRGIKDTKKHVKFGISPFGIGKPEKRPAGIAGFSQYDKLYADAELWLEKGWVDYFAPQLYWPIEQKPQAFGVLLDYWAGINPSQRYVWPGLFTSRVSNAANAWSPDEISNQIALTQSRANENPLVRGHIHFSMKALMGNRKGLADQLRMRNYPGPALIPASPWLDSVAPQACSFDWSKQASSSPIAGPVLISQQPKEADVAWIAIWARIRGAWAFKIVPASTAWETGCTFSKDEEPLTEVRVAAVDRVGNLGPWQRIAR